MLFSYLLLAINEALKLPASREDTVFEDKGPSRKLYLTYPTPTSLSVLGHKP